MNAATTKPVTDALLYLDGVSVSFDGFKALNNLSLVVAQGELRYCRRRPEFPVGEKYAAMERLLLPLARDGLAVDMMLGLTLYTRTDGTIV